MVQEITDARLSWHLTFWMWCIVFSGVLF